MNRRARSRLRVSFALVASLRLTYPVVAAEPAVVSHVTVTSDKTEDVSSLEAWKRSFIKEGMTDEQKAMAVWQSVVKFRHQENPPDEYLESSTHPHDPIKDFNVYGYGQCCCASANLENLARYAGLEARGWGIIGHSVPEVKWAGQWHMLDASLITYFPRPDGQVAGVEEITQNVKAWYGANPKLKGNEPALSKYMRGGNWRTGPELLRNSPGYDENGWLPAATHGWYSTMQEYADPAKSFVYEYGTALGYEVNVQLRKGERLTRNWSNKGLHVNALEGKGLGVLRAAPGKDDLRYSPKLGDLAPGRVGNGTLEYDVPLASAELAQSALAYENLAASPAGVAAADAGQPGVLVVRMPTSYVYLSGEADLKATVGQGGSIVVALSDNNGLDWRDVATITESGSRKIDLKEAVYRRYDYRLRFTLNGARTALGALKLTHDVQHSQRALPALAQGTNTITFAAGRQEGTITVQGNTDPKAKGKNLLLADFHPTINGFKGQPMFLSGGKGDVTVPIATPGEMTRIRVGAHYRARGAKDAFDVRASFDEGKTWTDVGRLEGPTAGNSKYFVFDGVPAGAKKALVRLDGRQNNTLGFFDLRIDADYAEPSGGFTPVKVTYVWDEKDVEKRDVHVAKGANETYTIACAQKPLLKSLIVERAD
jgi:hypothetical protein